MAFGANSKAFSAFLTDALKGTLVSSLANAQTPKCALYNDTTTPDQTVTSANSAYNAGVWVTSNEVYQAAHWTQAGLALASQTLTFASNVVKYDAADTASLDSATTLANVYGCLIYDDTLTTPVADQGICFLSFGGVQSVTNGLFTVVYNASGIVQLTL